MFIEEMTKEQLSDEILFNEDGLYEKFDEEKFLSNEYTVEEMREIVGAWILEGDETYEM